MLLYKYRKHRKHRKCDFMEMNYPTYFTHNDFIDFKDYLLGKNNNIKIYKKGSYINSSSESNKYIHFILHGKVIDIFIYKNGYEKILTTHGENTIVPLYSPINSPIERPLIFKALTDCSIISFTREEFSNLLQENKDLNNEMYISYLKHTKFLLYENLSHSMNNGLARISVFLLSYLKQYKPKDDVVPFSQKHIGSAVGLNTINTSRNIKILKDMNLIDTGRNKIIVLNKNKLTNFYKSINSII